MMTLAALSPMQRGFSFGIETAALFVAVVSIAVNLLSPGRGHHSSNRLDRLILLDVNGDRERIDC